MNKQEIKQGDKVEDIFREWHTVVRVEGTTVYTLDGNIHITKIISVLTPDDYGYWDDEEDGNIPDDFPFSHQFTDIG